MTRDEGELRFRAILLNRTLKWLRSGDEMLIDPKYRAMVPGAIERTTKQLHQVQAELRELTKVDDPPPPVKVGLKPARLDNEVLR